MKPGSRFAASPFGKRPVIKEDSKKGMEEVASQELHVDGSLSTWDTSFSKPQPREITRRTQPGSCHLDAGNQGYVSYPSRFAISFPLGCVGI